VHSPCKEVKFYPQADAVRLSSDLVFPRVCAGISSWSSRLNNPEASRLFLASVSDV
jgi:hypothetical protein